MATVDDEAVNLAERHYHAEAGVSDIFRVLPTVAGPNGQTQKIVLLEVNQNTVPSGIMPIEFAPAPSSGVHFPSVIIEVTPSEFEQIKSNQLKLPPGWSLGASIPRPADAAVQ